MKFIKKIAAIFAVSTFIVFTFPVNCLAEQKIHTDKKTTTEKFTPHPPGHRAPPAEKISQPPKWPWIAAGGLAVAVVAMLVLGNSGGDDSPPEGGGNVAFEW